MVQNTDMTKNVKINYKEFLMIQSEGTNLADKSKEDCNPSHFTATPKPE
jgi:hypothetical protein